MEPGAPTSPQYLAPQFIKGGQCSQVHLYHSKNIIYIICIVYIICKHMSFFVYTNEIVLHISS